MPVQPSSIIHHRAFHLAVIAGILCLAVYAVGASPPKAGIVALDIQPAATKTLDYIGPLDDGQALVLSVIGEEDPWNVRFRFKGGSAGVTDPRLGTTGMVGELRRDQESGPLEVRDLLMGENELKARTEAGTFYVQVTYEEGRVPHIDEIRVTPEGIVVDAADPNEPSGDRVVAYEFTLRTASGTLVAGPVTLDAPVYKHIPAEPDTYRVTVRAQDSRGAWSVTLTKDFTVIATLHHGHGSSTPGGIREGTTTIQGPAYDQRGNPIFQAAMPGGGPASIGARVMFGGIRILFCPIYCDDPFNDGLLKFFPGLRDALLEALA